jgi:hypothetical protein
MLTVFKNQEIKMSGHGFHVHGAHEHELEHKAHSGDSLAQSVALMTAILSTIGAVLSYQGGVTQNEAMLQKNEAVLKKTEASNLWSYYQAKSSKQNLAELAAGLTSGQKTEFYKKEIERYRKEKEEIKVKAEALEAESKKANDMSEQIMHPHHRFAQAMTLVQIAISLASITVLTRRRWLFVAAAVAAIAGAGVWISTLFLH